MNIKVLLLPAFLSLALSGCIVTSAVNLAATTVMTAGKIAVKGTGALINAAIPDKDKKKDKEKKSAVFKLEAGLGLYGGQEAGFFDEFHAVRQQAFADYEAGEMLLFEHAHGKTVFEQQGGGDCAGGAGADDGDIAGLGHVWSP